MSCGCAKTATTSAGRGCDRGCGCACSATTSSPSTSPSPAAPVFARTPVPLPPAPPSTGPKARVPEPLPVSSAPIPAHRVVLTNTGEPSGVATQTGVKARIPEPLPEPVAPVAAHRVVLKNQGTALPVGPPTRGNGEVVGVSLPNDNLIRRGNGELVPSESAPVVKPPARVPPPLPVSSAPIPAHRAALKQPTVPLREGPAKRANGEVVGTSAPADGLARRASGAVMVEAPMQVKAKVAPVLSTAGMTGREVRGVEKLSPPTVPSRALSTLRYPTTASRPEPEATPIAVTWTFTDEGPLPLQMDRLESAPFADTAPAPPDLGPLPVRVAPELRTRLEAGGSVRARFVFQPARPTRAFLDDELVSLVRGEPVTGTAAQRRAAWFARELRAAAPERAAWAAALRAYRLKVVEQGQLVPYVDVEGPASAVRAALAVTGLASADLTDAPGQVDSWGADIRAALGLNAFGLPGAGASGGLLGAYRGEGLTVGIYEGTLFPFHPAFAVGPPGLRELRPGACEDLGSARRGQACQVTPAASRIISVRDCSERPCVERIGGWTFEDFWENNTGGDHALGSAHVLAGDLSLGQDPWYEQKLGRPDGTLANVRRLGSGLLPSARLVSWGDNFARAADDLAAGTTPVRTLSWSGGSNPLRSNPSAYSDGRTDVRDAAARVLYLAGISLVSSAGNRNENLRLPTYDELMDTIEAKLREPAASQMWPSGVPAVIFPELRGSNPPRRMSRTEYRDFLSSDVRGWLVGPRHDEVREGRARAYEFADHATFWKVTRELRIPAPVTPLKPLTDTPDFCRERPAEDGTLSVIGPWCALDTWDALLRAPTPCTPDPGVYCNEGATTIGAPSAQTVIVVAGRMLAATGPGDLYAGSSMGGAFQPEAGPRLARNIVTSAGFTPFNRPAQAANGGPAWQGYGNSHGQTSGATPTIAAVVAALQQRLPAEWAQAWASNPRASELLTHPGLMHALLLALGDGTPIDWQATANLEHLAGLSRSFGSGSPEPALVRWTLGERAPVPGRRRVLSLGLLRRIQPGTTTSLPRHTSGGGGRLREARASVFFVDPLYEATGTSRVPLSLRLVEGAALAGGTTLAFDDGAVNGAPDALSVENRRRVLARWPAGRPAERATRWQVRVPRLASVAVSSLVTLDVFYALIEAWEP